MKEVKEKYLKEIYFNVLKAIITMLFFFVLNKAYENVSSGHFALGIEIFTMIFLFIAIYIFEQAYKKDDGKLAIQGIEILVLSTYTLTSRHIANKFDFDFKIYSLVVSYIFAIYFILKGIVVYTKGRREEAEELSDIREIVKKEEPLKKEATKRTKEDNKEEINAEIKDDNKKSEETKKSTTKKKTAKKTTTKKTTTKKATTTAKSTSTKKNSATTKSATTKKTTKKAEEKPKTTKNKKQEDEKIENKEQNNEKPKRKRVKKEVKEND